MLKLCKNQFKQVKTVLQNLRDATRYSNVLNNCLNIVKDLKNNTFYMCFMSYKKQHIKRTVLQIFYIIFIPLVISEKRVF